ncbi:MAG: DUF4381 domain-containing protein [Bacteroidota bacterium]
MRKDRLHKVSYSSRILLRKCLVLLCFLGSVSMFAQVRSSIDTTLIRIGEEIKYTIEVEADSTALVLFPEGQSFAPLEVIESYKVDTSFAQAKMRLIKKYGLTQFDSGTYKVPSQRVMIDDRGFNTDSSLVEVRDVPVDTTQQKMFDIKPAIEVDGPALDLIWLFYILLPIIILGAIAYFIFRRKKLKEERERQLPPYEEAMVALKQLDASEFLIENKSKAYYSSLTEIVKRYLDREVDNTALESTSDEVIERLQLHKDAGSFDFDHDTIQKLADIFKRADLVKFAKMRQEMSQARADRSSIEEIINETKEALPEPTEEELLQNELYAQEQRRKRRFKRLLIGTGSGFLVLLITTVILASTYGWDYLKDNVIGHPTKDLVEGQWYRSEYGIPAVVMETPVVLKRMEIELPEEVQTQIKDNSVFIYGSLIDRFYVIVSTTQLAQPVEVDLEQALEGGLSNLEKQGAKNLIVKRESFETDKGVKGLKAHGSFEPSDPSVKPGTKQNYQMLIFGQDMALQQIVIAYSAEDRYAEEMVNRIINSVELEVQGGQPKPKKEE